MANVRLHVHRADRAEQALSAYQRALGEDGPHNVDLIRDLLQDLLHWLAQEYSGPARIRLQDACRTACRDFPLELAEEEEYR